MRASYNSQSCGSKNLYSIQFETDDPNLFRYVEEACQRTIDICKICKNPELSRIYGLRWAKEDEQT